MRRSILLAVVAALALAIGMSTAASAGVDPGAQATAKKKAAKCKAKKKKAKRKAGKSAVDGTTAAKKKAKCKAKAKKKAKKKPAAGTAFGDGVYEDKAHSVTAEVTGKGTQVLVRTVGSKCVGRALIALRGPLTQKGSAAEASATENVGGAGTVKWKLTVQDGLAYQLDTTWDIAFPDTDPCHEAVTIKGTFKA